MQNPYRPIDFAKMACNTMMHRYEDVNSLPPVLDDGRASFNYHQGVLMTGMSRVYLVCHDEKYRQYIEKWVESIQDEHGNIREYTGWLSLESLDFRQPGNVLSFMYEQTGERHYLDLLAYLTEDLYNNYPRNQYGGFWHFYSTPDQMWLDGLYMAGPLLAKYARYAQKPEYLDLAVKQILLMYSNMRDEKSGLLFHGWDPGKNAEWADKNTGLSPEVWGRACGWFVLAIADILDYVPENYCNRQRIIEIFNNIISSIIRYQSAEGRWYEVVNKWEDEGNWPENSCTCLFIYAIAKGVRMGYLPQTYLESARKAYERVIETLEEVSEEGFSIGDICVGTCIENGTYEHYINRDRVANDLHGIGAFLLMASEMELVL